MEELNYCDVNEELFVSQPMLSESNSSNFSFDLSKEESGFSHGSAEQISAPLTLLSHDGQGGDDRFNRRFIHGTVNIFQVLFFILII